MLWVGSWSLPLLFCLLRRIQIPFDQLGLTLNWMCPPLSNGPCTYHTYIGSLSQGPWPTSQTLSCWNNRGDIMKIFTFVIYIYIVKYNKLKLVYFIVIRGKFYFCDFFMNIIPQSFLYMVENHDRIGCIGRRSKQYIGAIGVSWKWDQENLKNYKKSSERWKMLKFNALFVFPLATKIGGYTCQCKRGLVLLDEYKLIVLIYLFTYIHVDLQWEL